MPASQIFRSIIHHLLLNHVLSCKKLNWHLKHCNSLPPRELLLVPTGFLCVYLQNKRISFLNKCYSPSLKLQLSLNPVCTDRNPWAVTSKSSRKNERVEMKRIAPLGIILPLCYGSSRVFEEGWGNGGSSVQNFLNGLFPRWTSTIKYVGNISSGTSDLWLTAEGRI